MPTTPHTDCTGTVQSLRDCLALCRAPLAHNDLPKVAPQLPAANPTWDRADWLNYGRVRFSA